MHTFSRWCAAAACLSLIALPLMAESTTTDSQNQEPEITVVVTAERTPQQTSQSIASSTVVTAKEIRERGARTVADVLRIVPGIAMRQSGQPGSAATAFLRGAKANQVLVLLDGERISSPAFIGGTDLSKFPVEAVSRVEVTRGPVSSLYGSEAIGGVINIITRQPTGSSGTATLGYGANGRIERALSLQGSNERTGWRFSSSIPEYSGTRPNSDYSATDLAARVTMDMSGGWRLAVNGERYHDDLGLPNADANGTGYYDPDDRQNWTRENLSLSASRELGKGKLEWRAYRNRQELHNRAPGLDWFGDPVVNVSLITGTTKATELLYTLGGEAHRMVFGGEYRDDTYNDVETGSMPGTQHNTVSTRALFAQDRWSLGTKTDLVYGARLDDHSAFGSKVTPRLGISHALASGTRLRASYSEGFRAPNFVELYYKSVYGNGNPNLNPEKSRQYEVGLNRQFGSDTIDLALYTNSVRDLIAWTTIDTETFEGTYMNVQRARTRGMELSWSHRFENSVLLDLCYNYTDATNATTGKRLNGIPRNQVSLAVSGPVRSWNMGLTGRWTDGRPDLAFDPVTYASRSLTVPGRTIFDLTLTRHGNGRTDPYLVIRNLMNVAYEEVAGYRAEGRSVEIGMRSAW